MVWIILGMKFLKIFPLRFEPSSIGPVDSGYLVGPDDVIRLSIWGQAEFQYELTIDREGKVFIPNVGQITLSEYHCVNWNPNCKSNFRDFIPDLQQTRQLFFLM